MNFSTVNRYLGGRAETKLHSSAIHCHDDHLDMVADDDLLFCLATEDKHCTSSVRHVGYFHSTSTSLLMAMPSLNSSRTMVWAICFI